MIIERVLEIYRITLLSNQFIMAFISGYVSDESNKLISVGINIIDHIFIPSVLTAIVGFLALWVDKDGNGIPDKLEEEPPSRPTLMSVREDAKSNGIPDKLEKENEK